jgi:acetyl esterase/lipase
MEKVYGIKPNHIIVAGDSAGGNLAMGIISY